MQAPVKAMDPHGVTVISCGSLLFALATAACWFELTTLQAMGRGWWLATSITGLGIGVLTLLFLVARRRRHRARLAAHDADGLRREPPDRDAPTAP